jgi:hypothetical protein
LAAEQIIRRRREPTPAEDLSAVTDALEMLFDEPGVTALIARDQNGCPAALMGAVIDAEVCLIRLAISSCHEARWALHHHLVLSLIDRRVKHLLTDDGGAFGALAFPSQVQHFQHLHGYELCHVVPREAGLQDALPQVSSGAPATLRQ